MSTPPQSKMHEVHKSRRIHADVGQVSSLLEDITRTPDWNPLITKITPKKTERQQQGSEIEWEARVAGITITGSSVTVAWSPGKEYSWRNTERVSGLNLEARFLLNPVDGQTDLIASLTFSHPEEVEPLFNHRGTKLLLSKAVEKALDNINSILSGASERS